MADMTCKSQNTQAMFHRVKQYAITLTSSQKRKREVVVLFSSQQNFKLTKKRSKADRKIYKDKDIIFCRSNESIDESQSHATCGDCRVGEQKQPEFDTFFTFLACLFPVSFGLIRLASNCWFSAKQMNLHFSHAFFRNTTDVNILF